MKNGRNLTWEEIKEICENIKEKEIIDILRPEKIQELTSKNKGIFGQVIEKEIFNIDNNSDAAPDFKDAGIELKVTPLNISKKSKKTAIIYSPKERVKLGLINYEKIINELDFETSQLLRKCDKILFIFYLYDDDPKGYKIVNYYLYEIKKDTNYQQIKSDYEKIVQTVINGYAHKLSGSDTYLLEACTSANSGDVKVSQPNSNELAKPRAFAFKQRHIRNILANINNLGISELIPFLNQKLSPYQGMSINELANKFDLSSCLKSKSIKNILLCKMLGINSYSDFFETYAINKIMFKNIELKTNGKIKEEIGLIDINFNKEFDSSITPDFYSSELYDFIFNLTIIFFVWEQKNNQIFFKTITNYKFSDEDIINAESVWEKTKHLWLTSTCIESYNKNANRYQYNFTKISDKKTIHIRPHDQKRISRWQMANGEYIPKFQYWLNKEKIKI